MLQAQERINIPDEFICPITRRIMNDPVIATDGKTYERSAIDQWYEKKKTSPLARTPLKKPWKPNTKLSNSIQAFLNDNPQFSDESHYFTDTELLPNALKEMNCDTIIRLAEGIPYNLEWLNWRDDKGNNLLHVFCKTGTTQQVEALIAALPKFVATALAISQNNIKENALHISGFEDNTDKVKMILNALGDKAKDAASASDKDQCNPLHIACRKMVPPTWSNCS